MTNAAAAGAHHPSILKDLARSCGVTAPRMSPIAAQMASGIRAAAFLERMLELGEDPLRASDLQVFRELMGGLSRHCLERMPMGAGRRVCPGL
jgi:hypothetical protein